MSDLQLMIVEAEQRVPDFIKAGSDIVSIHVEPQASLHLDRGINQVTPHVSSESSIDSKCSPPPPPRGLFLKDCQLT